MWVVIAGTPRPRRGWLYRPRMCRREGVQLSKDRELEEDPAMSKVNLLR
jgi:hypothetical protein